MQCEAGGERGRPGRPQQPPSLDTRTAQEETAAIRHAHDEGYKYIDQGLSYDERGQTEQALTLYTKGLRCTDRVLGIDCNRPHCTGPKWDNARKLMQKMIQTKQQITTRVQVLINSDAGVARGMDDPPPSYEVATSPTVETMDMSWADGIVVDNACEIPSSIVLENATQIFNIPEGVQIFYISREGYVSAPSYPSGLSVLKFTENSQIGATNAQRPPAFIKAGEWTYPLVPGTSPVLQSSYGAYIFPDVSQPGTESSVGLILPANVSARDRTRFEGVMKSMTAMVSQAATPTEQGATATVQPSAPPREAVRPAAPREAAPSRESVRPARPPPPRTATGQSQAELREDEATSTKISKGLVTAAEWISWGLTKGAEKGGALLRVGSAQLKSRLKPEETPRKVDPAAQTSIYYVRQATGVAVKVSSFLVDKLSQATMALGRELAPHVRKQGEKLLPESLKSKGGDGRSKVDDVVEVAAGGLKGFATVYTGLEVAAKSLAKSIANETVHVVTHKYGKEVGEITENSLYSAGNAAMAGYTVNHLGVKAIAKRAAKDAGKAVVEDYHKEKLEKKSPENGYPPSGGGSKGEPM